ncbi:MAG: hypothetical protein ACOC8A_00095 [bacterium]
MAGVLGPRRVGLLVAMLVHSLPACARAEVEATVAERGLRSLVWDGQELVADGRPFVRSIVLETRTKDYQYSFEQADVSTPTVQAGEDGPTLAFGWGSAAFAYQAEGDRLRVAMTLTNTSRRTLANFQVQLMNLALPAPPEGKIRGRGRMVRSMDNLAIVEAVCGERKLLACVDTIFPPLHFGLGKATDKQKTCYPLLAGGGNPVPQPGAYTVHPHGLPRIAPGESATFRFSLRFAAADTAREAMVGDLCKAFREYWEPIGRWDDNRFIGAVFLPSDRGARTEGNPRGWKWFEGEKDFDIRTEDGQKRFEAKMLEFADRSVKVLREMDAQGVIIWNLEGGENPHPITYIGDPRMLPILNPEMDKVADRFFQKFLDAGLRTGVCIRPTQVYQKKDGTWHHGTGSHGPERNPLKKDWSEIWPPGLPWWRFYPVAPRMIDKIAYAKKRWGCTIFYVDTNGTFRPVGEKGEFKWILLTGHIWRQIKEEHRDVLLIPELRREGWTFHAAQWAYTAPYDQLDYTKRVATPDYVRALFPRARICNYVANTKPDRLKELHDACVQAVRAGDILMGRGWFMDAQDKVIQEIYEAAKGEPK